MPEPRILNLGCGRTYVEGAVNLDVSPRSRADLLHDLTSFPWPFPDGHFSEVRAYDVIEHLPDTVRTMEELHRVCRPGALVDITVPHFSSVNAFTPTHLRFFGVRSFAEHFCEGSLYTEARFKQLDCRLVFHPTLPNKIVWRLAGRFPEAYERRWAWVFPAWFINCRLEALKS